MTDEKYKKLQQGLLELLDLLQKEHGYLVANDISSVQATNVEKMALYDEINQIQHVLLKPENGADKNTISIETYPELKALAHQCQQLNEKNGAIIDLLSRHTKRSLQIIRGNLNSHENTYGPDGFNQDSQGSRTFTSA